MTVPHEPAGVRGQLRVAANLLAGVSDTARLDAELLLAHAIGIERQALLLDPDRHAVPESFAGLVARRMAHEPVAYITGWRDFWTIRLAVGPGVLIPRSDSEALIVAAVDHFDAAGTVPNHILDLGTGPGTLLLAALDHWREAQGTGVDASGVALDYARANAHRLGMDGRTGFIEGGWDAGGGADLILCNPPYVESAAPLDAQVREYEPPEALFAGADGLDAYRILMPALRGRLQPGGVAVVEIGYRQAAEVGALAAAAGFAATVGQDLAGRDRLVVLTPG